MDCSSPEILSFTVPRRLWNLKRSIKARSPDSDHRRLQKWWLLEVKQTFGYLKIMGEFEEFSSEGS